MESFRDTEIQKLIVVQKGEHWRLSYKGMEGNYNPIIVYQTDE